MKTKRIISLAAAGTIAAAIIVGGISTLNLNTPDAINAPTASVSGSAGVIENTLVTPNAHISGVGGIFVPENITEPSELAPQSHNAPEVTPELSHVTPAPHSTQGNTSAGTITLAAYTTTPIAIKAVSTPKPVAPVVKTPVVKAPVKATPKPVVKTPVVKAPVKAVTKPVVKAPVVKTPVATPKPVIVNDKGVKAPVVVVPKPVIVNDKGVVAPVVVAPKPVIVNDKGVVAPVVVIPKPVIVDDSGVVTPPVVVVPKSTSRGAVIGENNGISARMVSRNADGTFTCDQNGVIVDYKSTDCNIAFAAYEATGAVTK